MKKLTPIYGILTPEEMLRDNTYPGRGIVIGQTPDGKKAVAAYFIMGRSENSRNRIFTEKNGEVFTEPFDESKVQDPSLIIYAAVRSFGNHLVVTNGNQTDTVVEGLQAGKTFTEALESREFEPDGPNFTPRISGMLTFADGAFTYQMSILKSADARGTACNRFTFHYAPLSGLGHFLHTYVCDGNPIPTFQGEPERMALCDDIDEMAGRLWSSLDENNRISLYVRYIDLATGSAESRLINKNR
ncbi:MAG: inosine monophosphate cyclohydrolase [Clostridiales bacterium]|nr:inosine monophosphate cyclohydrolase [Clostridiales bacterium]